MVRFTAALLRGVSAAFIGVLIAGGTLTLAADRAGVQQPTLIPAAPTKPATLEVPDVTGQAYVFAKGILQQQGFAWQVVGPVEGFAANRVATQQPSPGTIVVDTGAPTVTLSLARDSTYVEQGVPEEVAPYVGTSVRLPNGVVLKPKPVAVPKAKLARGAKARRAAGRLKGQPATS